MKHTEIKKGMMIMTKSNPQSSLPNVECKVMDNLTRGHTRLVESPCVNGGTELGSIYTTDMEFVRVDNNWLKIQHKERTPWRNFGAFSPSIMTGIPMKPL